MLLLSKQPFVTIVSAAVLAEGLGVLHLVALRSVSHARAPPAEVDV